MSKPALKPRPWRDVGESLYQWKSEARLPNDDPEFDRPTLASAKAAESLVSRLRLCGGPPPHRYCATGWGGVAFEWGPEPRLFRIEFEEDGGARFFEFEGTKIVSSGTPKTDEIASQIAIQ